MWIMNRPLPADNVWQFKVQLHPEYLKGEISIYRIFEVDYNFSLDQFHFFLQGAMGWELAHLYCFKKEDKFYELQAFDPMEGSGDTKKTFLTDVFAQKGDKIRYDYDFGDSWSHIVTLHETVKPLPRISYPRLIEGARACPPENCGGLPMYMEYMQAKDDKKHPNYAYVKEMFPHFSPERFILKKRNDTLRDFAFHETKIG